MGPPFAVLSGKWTVARDPENAGRAAGWHRAPPRDARPAPVPGIIQQVFPDYHGVAWYWTVFSPPRAAAAGERILLEFGAVDYLAEVWVNGAPVGGHEGGETPFELDVTEAAGRRGGDLLAVRVVNPVETPIDGIVLKETPHRHKASADYMPGRCYNHGGIYLPVRAAVVPAIRVGDVFAEPDAGSGAVRAHVTVRNDTGAPVSGTVSVRLETDGDGRWMDAADAEGRFPPGDSTHTLVLSAGRPRLWATDDPFLHRLRASCRAGGRKGPAYRDDRSVRFGFRDFRVRNGFFHLNGKRIFLKCTHTGNHFPIGQIIPTDPDLMRRDLVYAKACGFNMVRFIAGVAWPEQLDCCDEIGLMVYEEHLAGWELAPSPRMAERYDDSARGMILRDRNHPSVAIWGMLNETFDGPVFRHAVGALQLVRDLDATRLVLLQSGRWDCDPSVGSVCNPGSRRWEHQWGAEEPGAAKRSNEWSRMAGGYFPDAGDAHAYPRVPLTEEVKAFLRNLGRGTRPVFLSEFGTGSQFNVVDEYRRFEQAGAPPDVPDMALIRAMRDRLAADWKRYGMEDAYPFLEDFLRESYRLHIRERRINFDLVRSNPYLCGYSITGMLDHGLTGEGLWTFWREWKPGIADALRDGWAPLRWSLFATPEHQYAGRPVRLEAVLASEDALPPGSYPVRFRVTGPDGPVWERRAAVRIPRPRGGKPAPFAVPVLCEEVVLSGPPGDYTFAAAMERGGAPAGDRTPFRLADPGALPRLDCAAAVWGVPPAAARLLGGRGVRCRDFGAGGGGRREIILVGVPAPAAPDAWGRLMRRVEKGATAVFLSPEAFKDGEDTTARLPLSPRGACRPFNDWLYHKECVAARHPVFAGLQAGGILDWSRYGQVIPHEMFEGIPTPEETVAAAFAVGYACPGGYASGLLAGVYRRGEGRLILNTLRILEHAGVHPAADRLLLNLAAYAAAGGRRARPGRKGAATGGDPSGVDGMHTKESR